MNRFLLICSVALLSACTPRLTPLEAAPVGLDAFVGEWAGTLTYADYSDDVTPTTLPITASTSSVQDPVFGQPGLLFEVSFREPDGSPAGSDRTLFTPLPDEPDTIGFDLERWRLLNQSADGTTLTYSFESEGEDNNRPSTIRYTITYENDIITNRKDVRYDGTDRFFERNAIELTRQ